MRASTSAAVGVVTELMDVHATLGVGVVACDIPGDGGGRGLGGLLKCHMASDLGVSSKDRNYKRSRFSQVAQQRKDGLMRSSVTRKNLDDSSKGELEPSLMLTNKKKLCDHDPSMGDY